MSTVALATHMFHWPNEDVYCLLSTAVFLVLIFTVYWLYIHTKRKYNQLKETNLTLRNRNFELEELIHCMAQLGNMSYYIGNINTGTAGNDSDIKIAESYIANMLPSDQSHFRENCRRIQEGTLSSFSGNYTLNVKGEIKRHSDMLKLIRLPESQYSKFILTAMDVSTREDRNKQLADNNLLVQAIFDNLPGFIFLKNVSSDFSYLRCNLAFSALLHKKPEDLEGKTDFELFDRQLAQHIRHEDMELARTHTLADNRWFFTTPDGQEHALRVISRILKRSDDSEYILGVGLDVTKQESIASKLRKRNKELRLLLSQPEKAVMLLDSKLNLIAATSDMQKRLSDYIKVDMTLNCQELCRCKPDDVSQCPAQLALQTNTDQECRNCLAAQHAVRIKVLGSEKTNGCYLAVSIDENEEQTSVE